jgi:hypothetical protein
LALAAQRTGLKDNEMNEPNVSLPRDEFAELFRALSAANKQAEAMKLPMVVHLTNMALMQVSCEWEGVSPENEKIAKLNAIFRSKARIALTD